MSKSLQPERNQRAPLAILWLFVACFTGCGVIADTHNRQGVRSAYRGDFRTAMASFQKAATRDPKNSDAYYNMAASLHQLGKQTKNQHYLTQAEQLYNQSLDYDPQNVDSYRGLAVLLAETQRSEKAFVLLKGWVQNDFTNPDAHTELARLYDEFKDEEAAIEQLQAALRIDHQHPRALTALAALRESEGNRVQALENYQRAYASQPRPELASRIATLQRSLGQSTVAGVPSGNTQLATPARIPRY